MISARLTYDGEHFPHRYAAAPAGRALLPRPVYSTSRSPAAGRLRRDASALALLSGGRSPKRLLRDRSGTQGAAGTARSRFAYDLGEVDL
jgi:hypothetical protein